MNAIDHPEFTAVYERWLSVCKQAGRDRSEAEAKARSYAISYCSRKLEQEQRWYEGKRKVGP